MYQKKIDKTFSDLPGCFGIADDIIAVGWREDGKDHDENLETVLECTRSTGVCFKEDKMVVRCKEIPFLGT